jgi:hypothetical protein
MAMSWRERARRRGGITEGEFLSGMASAGFVEVAACGTYLHEFTHPDTGEVHYRMLGQRETYARSLARMLEELEVLRRGHIAA